MPYASFPVQTKAGMKLLHETNLKKDRDFPNNSNFKDNEISDKKNLTTSMNIHFNKNNHKIQGHNYISS